VSYFPEKKHRIDTSWPSRATFGDGDVKALVGRKWLSGPACSTAHHVIIILLLITNSSCSSKRKIPHQNNSANSSLSMVFGATG